MEGRQARLRTRNTSQLILADSQRLHPLTIRYPTLIDSRPDAVFPGAFAIDRRFWECQNRSYCHSRFPCNPCGESSLPAILHQLQGDVCAPIPSGSEQPVTRATRCIVVVGQ